MQSVYEAALRSWSIPPAPTFVAAPACGLPECPTLASGDFFAWASFLVGGPCFSHGRVQQLRADGSHASAHDADDGRASFDTSGRASGPDGSRIANFRRTRICRSVLELVGGQTRGKYVNESSLRAAADGRREVRVAHPGPV